MEHILRIKITNTMKYFKKNDLEFLIVNESELTVVLLQKNVESFKIVSNKIQSESLSIILEEFSNSTTELTDDSEVAPILSEIKQKVQLI